MTPITKNVIVKDEFGNFLENTYPKRAEGLIKKGRAERVSECEIRLTGGSAPPDTEDNMNTFNITDNNNHETITVNTETGEVIRTDVQSGVDMLHAAEPEQKESAERAVRTLFFNPREWKPSKDIQKNIVTRSFITSPFGGLTESYMIGDWNRNWSQIETNELILEKNTDYEFVFWLNGGENSEGSESLLLDIVFDGNNENCFTYHLRRSFIRYERHYKGWYLYRIPFRTGEACYTKLRLIAMGAYATFIHADLPESYSYLPDDPAPVGLPQRHNIIFGEDGFPRNAWGSSKVFTESGNGRNGSWNRGSSFASNAYAFSTFDDNFMNTIMNRVQEAIEDELDADDIADEVIDSIDVDSIKEQIIQNIKDSAAEGSNHGSGFASEIFCGVDIGSIKNTISERIEEMIEEEFDADDIADEVMDSIDVDSIKEQIIQTIKDSLN